MDLNQNELAMLLERIKRKAGPIEKQNASDSGIMGVLSGALAGPSAVNLYHGLHRAPHVGRSKTDLAVGVLGSLGSLALGSRAYESGHQGLGWRKSGEQLFGMNKKAALRERNPALRKELLRAILAQSQGLR